MYNMIKVVTAMEKRYSSRTLNVGKSKGKGGGEQAEQTRGAELKLFQNLSKYMDVYMYTV